MEDRYQLMEPLGTGGMATVHKAKDQLLGRHVAIKRLLPHLAADPDAAGRFRREAQAAAGLNHPGIVTVYDAAEDEKGPYIVMELIEGETLASKVAREGPLGAAETAAIVRGAAEALDHAHANGVVHRDIKPSNLIVDDDGRVRLTDFGIARAMADPTMVTSTGEVVGTLAYMAPETLAGEPATPASDIYSLGAVSYQMLSGRPPFEADNIGALVTRIRDEPPPPLGPEVPSEIAGGVLRSLDKDPAMRPDTASAYATSLLTATTVPFETPPPTEPISFAAVAGAASSDSTDVHVIDEPGSPEAHPIDDQEARRSHGGFKVPSLLLIALALVLGLLALLAMAPGPDAATATTTTLSPNSPEAIAAGIYQLLDEMEGRGFEPDQIEAIRGLMDKIVQEASEGDREGLRDSLGEAFEKVSELPESEERQRLFDEFVRFAESYGFSVPLGDDEEEDNGGGQGRGSGGGGNGEGRGNGGNGNGEGDGD
jgi:serine/threonine protein kinase